MTAGAIFGAECTASGFMKTGYCFYSFANSLNTNDWEMRAARASLPKWVSSWVPCCIPMLSSEVMTVYYLSISSCRVSGEPILLGPRGLLHDVQGLQGPEGGWGAELPAGWLVKPGLLSWGPGLPVYWVLSLIICVSPSGGPCSVLQLPGVLTFLDGVLWGDF